MSLPGRPSKVTDPDFRAKVIDLVKRGVPRQTAAGALGVAPKTFVRWWHAAHAAALQVEEGLEASQYDRLLIDFRAAVEEAEQQWVAGSVLAVQQMALAANSGQVALELMRRHPLTRNEWNVPEKIELAIAESEEPPDSPDTLLREIARLEKIARERASVKAE